MISYSLIFESDLCFELRFDLFYLGLFKDLAIGISWVSHKFLWILNDFSEGCNKDVAVALISMHNCSLDAKIRVNLGNHLLFGVFSSLLRCVSSVLIILSVVVYFVQKPKLLRHRLRLRRNLQRSKLISLTSDLNELFLSMYEFEFLILFVCFQEEVSI